MRLVYVVPFQPWPPQDGASIRIWNTVRELSRHNDVDLVVQDDEPEAAAIAPLRALVHSLTFVPRRPRRPHPFLVAGSRVAAAVDTLQYPPPFLRRFHSAAAVRHIAGLLSVRGGADWLLCDTQLSGQLVVGTQLPAVRRALCLFDVYDMSFRRKAAATPPGPYKVKFTVDWLKARHYEQRIVKQFHLLSVVSPQDRRLIAALLPQTPVVVVPNGVDIEYFRPLGRPLSGQGDQGLAASSPSEARPRVLFLAHLGYEPNEDGVRFFLDDVWPLVRRQEPEATFMAAGKCPPAWLRARAESDPCLVVPGAVDDVRPLYAQADVVVVPIRLGGGTKLKLLEALAMGVPVVTTPQGCAGTEARDGRHVLVGATAEALATCVLEVLRDRTRAAQLAQAGRALVEERYGWPAIMSAFEAVLRDGPARPAVSVTR